MPPPTHSTFDVFLIDPPWPKKKGGIRSVRPNQGRLLDYPVMLVNDIFDLLDKDVLSRSSEIHTVFLWGVEQFLLDGEAAMTNRGYRLHTRLIWDKTNGVAPAFSVRFSHEYVSWFYKPKFTPVSTESRGKLTTVFREVAREHSRKPECVYDAIQYWFPSLRKMDVFSREPRRGWTQYGNQTQYFSGDR